MAGRDIFPGREKKVKKEKEMQQIEQMVEDKSLADVISQQPPFSQDCDSPEEENQIREFAYLLWERQGKPPGDGKVFWNQAKEHLRLRAMIDAQVEKDPGMSDRSEEDLPNFNYPGMA